VKTYKYSELISYQNTIENFFLKHKIELSPTSRIIEYFNYLKIIEGKRTSDKKSLNKLIREDKAKYYFSLFYVLDIYKIINSLDKASQSKTIVRKKLLDLMKGTYLLSRENSDNTKARNTGFELSFFSILYSGGLAVKLCDPNPDIELKSNSFTYNIECKRPQSVRSLEKNLKGAMKQIRKMGLSATKQIPVIVLSVDKIFFDRNDLILNSKDEKTARSFLEGKLRDFSKNSLRTVNKVIGDGQCIVISYLSCLVDLRNYGFMSSANFIDCNIYNFEKNLSNCIYSDLKTLLSKSFPSV